MNYTQSVHGENRALVEISDGNLFLEHQSKNILFRLENTLKYVKTRFQRLNIPLFE